MSLEKKRRASYGRQCGHKDVAQAMPALKKGCEAAAVMKTLWDEVSATRSALQRILEMRIKIPRTWQASPAPAFAARFKVIAHSRCVAIAEESVCRLITLPSLAEEGA